MLLNKSAAESLNPLEQGASKTWRARLAPITAALLGAVIIYGVGFAPGIAHGESHDTRHSIGFVCH